MDRCSTAIEAPLRDIKKLLSILVSVFVTFSGMAQCLSDVTKLLPEKSPSAFDAFGSSVAIHGEWAVVGSPRNDSTGYNTGLVYIYKKVASTWHRHAILVPPADESWSGFGNAVDINNDYIVVGSADVVTVGAQGLIAVYRKPASGWVSNIAPVAILRPAESQRLGSSIAIHPDGHTIVSGDMQHMIDTNQGSYPGGAIYIFRKGSGEWNDQASYFRITADPAKTYFYFGIKVEFDGQYLFVGSDSYMQSVGGAIDVYKGNHDWSAAQHMVTLQVDATPGYVSYPGLYFSAREGRLAALGNYYQDGMYLYIFEKGSEWGQSAHESYKIQIEQGDALSYPMAVTQTEDKLFIAASIRSKKEIIYKLEKTGSTFQNSSIQKLILDDRPFQAGAFGADIDTDGTNVIIGDPYTISEKRSSGHALIFPVEAPLAIEEIQTVKEQIHTTVDHQFGTAFLVKDDYLFVGATRDGHNAGLGSVSIYRKISGEWIYQTKIASPFSITPDSFFGFSLASNDEYLAVSAQLYDYDGAVFIFRKRSSWADLELVQTIKPLAREGRYCQPGHEVALNGNTLVIASHEDKEFESAVLFYKLESGQFQFDNAFTLGNSGSSHRKEINFSFYKETLAIGCLTSNPGGNLLPATVFLFEKDQNNKWDTVGLVPPNGMSTNAFGYRVKLTEDHLFIGDYAYAANGIWASGAVFVYRRPRNGWRSQPYLAEPTSIVTADVPREGDFFGYHFDVSGNVLVVGAPQSVILFNPLRDNTNPGSTYVIQGLDFDWKSTRQLFRYQGEFHNNVDRFGSYIHVSPEEFLVGAYDENQEDAFHSGAVYSFGMPPSLTLERAVCRNGGIIQLQGYSHAGVWSGPGVVDANLGRFDPALAGIGKHALTYSSPNCHFEGKMVLEVIEPPSVAWLPNPSTFCEGENSQILLQIDASGISNSYQWFFKAAGNDQFSPLGTIGAGYTANDHGEYYVIVDNGSCATQSSTQILSRQNNPIALEEVPVICTSDTMIQLVGSPIGGKWSGGTASSSGAVDPKQLSNGIYDAIYSYTTSEGCSFSRSLTFKMDVLEQPMLQMQGTLCDSREVKITVQNPQEGEYTFVAEHGDGSTSIISQGYNQTQASASDAGIYHAVVENENCSATSASVVVDSPDRDLTLKIPDKPTCYLGEASIHVENQMPGEVFRWYYQKTSNDPVEALNGDTYIHSTSNAGFFKVESTYGACEGTSEWVYVAFTSPDSLFVPNVFTPNGDEMNDVFEISLHEDSEQSAKFLQVFNRYGQRIFEVTNDMRWNGGDHPSAVYFWYLSYSDCDNRPVKRRGYVHLQR